MKTFEVKDGGRLATIQAADAEAAVRLHEPNAKTVHFCQPSAHRPEDELAYLVTVPAGKGYNTRSLTVREVATAPACQHVNTRHLGLWDGRSPEGEKTAGITVYCYDCKGVLHVPHGFSGNLADLEADYGEYAQLVTKKLEEASS